ncbi:Protein PAT1 1 [Chionoecetes opilio]|uniref:Protein PAT1 1 n=1 Tax=Chionoecetes opilio TaxID=41210 RepID=A0A8J4Y612_CHIOP|nr:Protein PAT1 1 [Chionoecetes opilio]
MTEKNRLGIAVRLSQVVALAERPPLDPLVPPQTPLYPPDPLVLPQTPLYHPRPPCTPPDPLVPPQTPLVPPCTPQTPLDPQTPLYPPQTPLCSPRPPCTPPDPLPEDGAVEGGHEDEEYDALNDETFGSASVVDGDWEENHQQLASLTEARRQSNKRQQNESALLNEQLQQLGLGGVGGYDGPTSAPISIRGYQGGPHIGSSLLGGPDLPGSPSNSIWTPSPGVDKLQPVGTPPGLHPSQPLGLQSVKTVAELEQEMKLQSVHTHPSHGIQVSGGLPALRAEDLEKELARHSLNKATGQAQHWPPFQRPPGFNQGMIQWQMQQQQQQQQQQFPPRQQQQQQQQHPRFMNTLHGGVGGGGNTKSVFNQPPGLHHPPHNHHNHEGSPNTFIHPHGPPPHHPQHPHNNPPPSSHHPHLHHHLQQQHHHTFNNTNNNNGYNNQLHHHHHPHHPPPHHHHHPHHQPPGYGYHHSPRAQDGSYFNHNGSDSQGRGSYERWGYDRRSYEQRGGQYERKGWGEDHGPQHPSRTRRDSEAEWEEWHRCRELDEYSCLMTPREKGWLKYIQAMQLHSDTPYRDDYYYVMHSVKQQRKREEEVVELDGLQLLLPDRAKESSGREYEPPRLENSLGKLQVVSVNAPRKIIDLQVVHLDPSHPTTSMQREMRRHRHLLLYLEKLFNTMMELDDLERRIRHLPDCPTRDMFRSKSRTLSARLWSTLNATPDRLMQVLCIRKGKSLVSRLLGWVGEREQEGLVGAVLQNMALLARKDAHDQQLALLWPATDRLVASASATRLLGLAAAFNNNALAPAPSQRTNLAAALYSKYGVSLVLALLVRGEQLHAMLLDSPVWQDFLGAIIAALATSACSPPGEGAVPKATAASATDGNKNEMAAALPSVALAASPCRPGQHLARCGKVEAALLKAAQEKMAQLEATHTRSQSPAKA